MRPATWPRDDGLAERLMVIDAKRRTLAHTRVGALPEWLREGDLVVVNDAATLPASLRGTSPTGAPVELRLAAQSDEVTVWDAVIFGDGDWRTRTEHRPAPPELEVGDVVTFTSRLRATVVARSTLSARLLTVRFDASGDDFWRALYAHGRAVQYAHLAGDVPLWEVQTVYAGRPWAMELPSAGRPLRWSTLAALAAKGVGVARITHAAGLSATGDDTLDALLPLPERYDIPAETVRAIADTRARHGRVIAIGTSVVRALEGNAALHHGLVAEVGVTSLRVTSRHAPRVVDAVFSGMHEPGTSHFELLSAFAPPSVLLDAVAEGEALGYLQHEFGDSCLVLAA